jgi:2-phospho-L-lactate guanylyltransferase
MSGQAEWAVTVPFRSLKVAKTRLAVACREDLALVFLRDTLAALAASPRISSVVVVSRDAALAETIGVPVIEDQGSGIDDAVAIGQRWLRDLGHQGHYAVILPDLPALRTIDVDTALGAASQLPRTFVPDSTGKGTTFLTARQDTFSTAFGNDSAQRHMRLGYHPILLDVPSLRQDVDTIVDLVRAARMGVGRHTQRLLTTNHELQSFSLDADRAPHSCTGVVQ